ncbi:hypothetical protein [Streptomyces sp. NPDC005731]|uniref:hypothetical protein n=1 Tax=unclassified Streptomyces TaxID=2593676 RepID=UPI0033D53DA9
MGPRTLRRCAPAATTLTVLGAATVMYRFTTRDGRAAVIRDPNRGWGFLPIGCVTLPSPLYND